MSKDCKNSSFDNLDPNNLFRLLVIMFPVLLKSRSEGTDIADIDKYFLAKVFKFGNAPLIFSHTIIGSSLSPTTTLSKYDLISSLACDPDLVLFLCSCSRILCKLQRSTINSHFIIMLNILIIRIAIIS